MTTYRVYYTLKIKHLNGEYTDELNGFDTLKKAEKKVEEVLKKIDTLHVWIETEE